MKMDMTNNWHNKLKQIINEDYKYNYSISYMFNEQVQVYANTKEGCDDLLTRLTPYFSIKTDESSKSYEVYQKQISIEENLWFQIQTQFSQNTHKIVAHNGNSSEQLREYKVLHTPLFRLYQSTDQTVIVCILCNKILILSPDIKKISKETRRVVKDVIISRLVEKNNGIIFHCAIATKDQEGIVIMGGKGSGKTARLIKQILNGADFVTSDRGYYNPETGYIQGWPEPMNITTDILKLLNLDIPPKFFKNKDNGKIAVPYHNISSVFNTKIIKDCKIKYILFPVLQLNQKSNCRLLSSDEIYEKICEHCLSPNDVEHPHWLELILLDSNKYLQIRNKNIYKLSNECVGIELRIGNDSNEQKCLERFLKQYTFLPD